MVGKQETGEEREERRRKRERGEKERNSGGLVPIAASPKNGPHGTNVAHYVREGASFFAGDTEARRGWPPPSR